MLIPDKYNLDAINVLIEKLRKVGFSCYYFKTTFEFPICVGDTAYATASIDFVIRDDHYECENFLGTAYCSTLDNFDRAVGIRIAFYRALCQLRSEYDRETMKEWLD